MAAHASKLETITFNAADFTEAVQGGDVVPAIMKAQVLLDRANISSGEVDGKASSRLDEARQPEPAPEVRAAEPLPAPAPRIEEPRVERVERAPQVEEPRIDAQQLLSDSGLVMVETDRVKAQVQPPTAEDTQPVGRPRRERTKAVPQDEELVQIETRK